MRRLRLAAVLASVLAASLVPALPAAAQTLRIGMRDDPDILDPTFSRTYVGTVVMTALCDKLFDFDSKLAVVPMLASGYEWTDSTTLVIHLKPNVQFHDGEPMDAAAVKYTLERDLNAPGSFRRSEIGAMDHVEIVDPLTVRVVMKQPFTPFPAILTDRAGMMVPPKAAEAAGKEFGLHPVCSGPFRFVERVAQDRVVLDRAPNYREPNRVHYDRVIYRVIPDSSIRLANLQAGALDLTEIAPLDVDTVKRDPKLKLESVISLGYGSLTVNIGPNPRADTPLGRDPRVRHALELALDRDALNSVVFGGLYQPTAQATSAASPYYAPSIPIPKRDVAQAKALLKAAGVATPLRVDLVVYNTPQGVQAGEVMQSMVAEAGFDLHVNAMEFGTAISAVNRGDFQVALGGWSGLLDPDSDTWSFLHTGGALNMSHYSNAAVDTGLDDARKVADVAGRRALYEGVFRQVNTDLPQIYLWTPRNIAGMSAKVTGLDFYADGLLRLQDVQTLP